MATARAVYLAVDLGASSGRVVAGLFDGRQLTLEECHRFENGGVPVGGRLLWDVLALWREINEGLRAAAARYGESIVSVGVDTWGVDFGLLAANDELLANPYCYRDRQTEEYPERAFSILSREEIFAETGLQFLPFNTLFQLAAMRAAGSPWLEYGRTMLMMPDLFHWMLTGEKSNEYTNVSTTQLFNPATRTWSQKLIERFDLPAHLFGEIHQPGTRLGPLRRDVAEQTNLKNVEVILPGTHDTASAVMAVPARGTGPSPDWCYLSSGTWSLMGAEVARPVINDLCRTYNFTNEAGVGGTIRLLKNIAGLWLVQECRRIWKLAGQDWTWDKLVQEAESVPLGRSLVDPDHPRFLAPKDMPEEIRAACRETGQPVPDSVGEVIRCALDSLALRYRTVLGWLEQLVGHRLDVIHIVGGGVQNRLLCQMTADACERRVLAGPVEATAIGNVMMQAVSRGDVADIAEARGAIGSSFTLDEYTPRSPQKWQEPLGRFQGIVQQMTQR